MRSHLASLIKLGLITIALSSVVVVGCASDASDPDVDVEDVDVSSGAVSARAQPFVGRYSWQASASGDFVDFRQLSLEADGTYSASVDSALVEPAVRCDAPPCTAAEVGRWGTSKSGDQLKIVFTPPSAMTRSYWAAVDPASRSLTLRRYGRTTTLLREAATEPVRPPPPPPPPPATYGFTPGVKVAAQGAGPVTSRIGSGWECRKKTTPPIPCGGWVSVTPDGRVVVGVLGHEEYYSHVSGVNGADRHFPFPPSMAPRFGRTNPFWNERATIELDGAGRGSFVKPVHTPSGDPYSTESFEVTAIEGAMTVAWTRRFAQGCGTVEACVFKAVAP